MIGTKGGVVVLIIGTVILLAMSCTAYGYAVKTDGSPATEWSHEETTKRPSIYTTPRTLRAPDEVALYAAITAGVVALILLLVPRAVTHPAAISIVPLARPLDSVGDVSDFMDRSTQSLMALGFLQQLDFSIPELPHRGFYRLMSMPNGHHTVMVAEIEAHPKTSQNPKKEFVTYFEFQTVLDNGCKVNTSNTPIGSPLKPPPQYLVTRHPRVASAEKLFRIHLRDVDRMRSARGGRIWPQKLEDFVEEFTTEWRDITEYQVSLGLLKQGKNPEVYQGRTTLLLRAMAPRWVERPRAWWAAPVPVFGAILTGLIVWAVPRLIDLLGLGAYPVAAKELEAYLVLIPAVLAGYLVGTGGAVLGLACYAPTLVLFNAGPVAHAILLFLAMTAGSVGEKARNWPVHTSPPFYRYFSPEIYVGAVLLVVAGL